MPSALRIPAPVRVKWAHRYSRLLSDARYRNDYKHWMLVFMFEKLGLAAPRRGGKKHKSHYSTQLDEWERDPVALWRKLEACRPEQSFRMDNSPAARGKRAVAAARNGLAARAVAALDSGALATPGPETTAKLASKHPPKGKPIEHRNIDSLPSAQSAAITEAIVEKSIRTFKRGTAARGLRAQHLIDALNSEAKAQFLTMFTRTVRFLAEGQVPVVFAPFVAGASLTPLDKSKNGVFDVRPIAAGEILRRVVAKCLCATQKERAGKYFIAGGQYGVA